jgi:hypothetical protein
VRPPQRAQGRSSRPNSLGRRLRLGILSVWKMLRMLMFEL